MPLNFCLTTFLVDILSVFNTLYLQVLFITQEQLGKSSSAASTFKCWGSTAAVVVFVWF